MQIQVVKSKIHRVSVTGADLNYIGSITIDEALLEAANIVEGEKVAIVNVNNGERLETYAIKGPQKYRRNYTKWTQQPEKFIEVISLSLLLMELLILKKPKPSNLVWFSLTKKTIL